MAIATTSSNYIGRRKDISILQYPDASGVEAQTVFPVFGKTTRMCAGVQKLVQKYAIILLTNINSQENFPTFGADFLYPLQAGISPVDNLQATQIFKLASYNAVNTLKRYQIDNPDIPADETILAAELTNISVYGGAVSFEVTIRTEAGDAIDFVVPIPK